MKKKFLLVLIMILFCAGCKVKYNIKINEDGTVEETAVASETPEFYDEYTHTSVGLVISRILSQYEDILNEKKYDVKTNVYVNNDSGVTLTKKYNDFKEYIGNSILYTQFTDKIDYTEDGDKITINAKGKFSKSEQNQDYFYIDESSIIITVPYKVLDNNADKVQGNTYIWNFDKKSNKDKEIKLVYSKSKIDNLNIDYSVIIVIGVIILLAIISIFICLKFNTSRKEANKL